MAWQQEEVHADAALSFKMQHTTSILLPQSQLQQPTPLPSPSALSWQQASPPLHHAAALGGFAKSHDLLASFMDGNTGVGLSADELLAPLPPAHLPLLHTELPHGQSMPLQSPRPDSPFEVPARTLESPTPDQQQPVQMQGVAARWLDGEGELDDGVSDDGELSASSLHSTSRHSSSSNSLMHQQDAGSGVTSPFEFTHTPRMLPQVQEHVVAPLMLESLTPVSRVQSVESHSRSASQSSAQAATPVSAPRPKRGMRFTTAAAATLKARAQLSSASSNEEDDDAARMKEEPESVVETPAVAGSKRKRVASSKAAAAAAAAAKEAAVDSDSEFGEPSEAASGNASASGLDKRARNKLSASQYRKRRKVYLDSLESRVGELDTKVSSQAAELAKMADENRMLREQISFFQRMANKFGGATSPAPAAAAQASNQHYGARAARSGPAFLMLVLASCILLLHGGLLDSSFSSSPSSPTSVTPSFSASVAGGAPIGRRGRSLLSVPEHDSGARGGGAAEAPAFDVFPHAKSSDFLSSDVADAVAAVTEDSLTAQFAGLRVHTAARAANSQPAPRQSWPQVLAALLAGVAACMLLRNHMFS